MMRKVLRPFELVLLAVIGAVEWLADWMEHQTTGVILGIGMLLGIAATIIVAGVFASLR